MPSIKKWTKERSEKIGDFRIFSLRKQWNRSESGKHGDFYVMDSPDWVNVIPLTANNEVVLIEQYRHGIDEVTLEIPGGMVDETDANPMESAIRELRKESGYVSDDWVELGYNSPNPALNSNRCFSYLARNATFEGEQQLDGMEEISVTLVPLEKIPQLIMEAKIIHSLVISAFYFLDNQLSR